MTVAHESRVVVVGQGYVGLPLAVRAVEVGHTWSASTWTRTGSTGCAGRDSFIDDVTDADLAAVLEHRPLHRRRDDAADLAGFTRRRGVRADAAARRCAGPALHRGRRAAARPARASRGACVVLESTTYPGTTEEVFVPILEAGSGLRAGARLPRRLQPRADRPEQPDLGAAEHAEDRLRDRRGLVGGGHAPSTTRVVDRTVPAPGTREAELAKLLENTFRHVNIALVNELAMYCHELGIDVWSVIDMAATKPFGFMKFTPGPRRRWALPADRPVVPVVAGPPGARPDLPVRRDRQRRQRQHARLRRHAGDRAAQPPQAGGQRQPGPAGGARLQAQLGRRRASRPPSPSRGGSPTSARRCPRRIR